MKYFFTLLITLFCFSSFGFSQSQNTVTEIVYLKNGSVIKGVILEQVPDDYLKMQIYDGSIFVFKMEEVEKITKEFSSTNSSTPKQTQLSDQTSSEQDGIRASGGRAFIDLGYAFGTGNFDLNRMELTTSAGYQFNPYLFLGGGIGAHYYSDGFGEIVLPLFIDIRTNFMNSGNVIPFIGLKLGYSFVPSESFASMGFYFSPTLGVKYLISDTNAVNLSIGYSCQYAEVYVYDYYSYYYGKKGLGALALRLGLEF